jgi:hypothetical protein
VICSSIFCGSFKSGSCAGFAGVKGVFIYYFAGN